MNKISQNKTLDAPRKLIEMSKILIISALLCAVPLYIVQADDVAEYHLENPITLESGGYLYTLWKTNTSVHINSTKENFKPCSITVHPVKDFAMMIQGKKLPNHKFLLWGYRNYNELGSHRHNFVSANYTALIVDPLSCSYKAIDIPADKISDGHGPMFYSHVLLSNNGFDFFSPGLGKCLPCRFSLEGEPVPLDYQLELEEEIAAPYMYNIANDVDSSKGYIYTVNFKNNTAVIKKLDEKFKVLKQVLLEHPIHSLSVKDNNEQLAINICYASRNTADSFRRYNFSVHCEKLDSDFNSKFTVRLPVPDDRFVFGFRGITHQVDSFGNMFIALIQVKLNDSGFGLDTRLLRFFTFDKTGKLVERRDYEEINRENDREIFELHSHLLGNKKFCIVHNVAIYKGTLNVYSDTHEFLACLDVSKYVK